jgi:beta-glucosidase
VRDLVSSVTTFEMSLVGFERMTLKPGETKPAKFVVRNEDLSLINCDGKRVVEPGEFKFMVGTSSTDLREHKTLVLVGPDGDRGPVDATGQIKSAGATQPTTQNRGDQ